ncbi:MAG: hypothetical protein EBT92_06125 [Planctomycetes bacterium]|nr:hypothetical protein [Planctomycetota bacterium]NBY01216.1 hypothetical protein [Planctomycetota bacterium]
MKKKVTTHHLLFFLFHLHSYSFFIFFFCLHLQIPTSLPSGKYALLFSLVSRLHFLISPKLTNVLSGSAYLLSFKKQSSNCKQSMGFESIHQNIYHRPHNSISGLTSVAQLEKLIAFHIQLNFTYSAFQQHKYLSQVAFHVRI